MDWLAVRKHAVEVELEGLAGAGSGGDWAGEFPSRQTLVGGGSLAVAWVGEPADTGSGMLRDVYVLHIDPGKDPVVNSHQMT